MQAVCQSVPPWEPGDSPCGVQEATAGRGKVEMELTKGNFQAVKEKAQ